MKHKDKLKMARRMLSREEIKKHIPPFLSVKWKERAIYRKWRHRKKNSPK